MIDDDPDDVHFVLDQHDDVMIDDDVHFVLDQHDEVMIL